jgi:hypothetical protein
LELETLKPLAIKLPLVFQLLTKLQLPLKLELPRKTRLELEPPNRGKVIIVEVTPNKHPRTKPEPPSLGLVRLHRNCNNG